MLFAIICRDRSGVPDARRQADPAHLGWLDRNRRALILAGPVLDGRGEAMGSLMVVEAADQATAQAFVNADPHTTAGVFADIEVLPFRPVFKGRARVG